MFIPGLFIILEPIVTYAFLLILSSDFLLRTHSMIYIPFGDCVTRQRHIKALNHRILTVYDLDYFSLEGLSGLRVESWEPCEPSG